MLKDLIKKLYVLQNENLLDVKTELLIEELLEENNLVKKEMVPEWFIMFLNLITTKKTVSKTYFTYVKSQGDIANFLVELEELIHADWDNYGEAVEVVFDKIGVKAFISSESDFFKIEKIDRNV